MTVINLNRFAPTTDCKPADRKEWAVCGYAGITRTKHDSAAYDKDSDVNFGTRHISVKSSGFSLMAGSLCEGLTEFDAIWDLYETKAHSNEWCYVTADFTGYFMDREEFKSFVYSFCTTEKESAKNGGAVKIRCRKETAKMLRWLEERA